jgi:hypothetical protein
MNRRFLFFTLLLLFISCSGRGELVNPPAGMEQAVKDYLSKSSTLNYKLVGLSVRAYPKEVYLISADTEYTVKSDDSLPSEFSATPMPLRNSAPEKKAPPELKSSNLRLIAEKGLKDGQEYWQISPASEAKLKTLKIN